jgi:transcription initiation factor TFIIIB Brf1 subunit/transcription initiation factor TFIIB
MNSTDDLNLIWKDFEMASNFSKQNLQNFNEKSDVKENPQNFNEKSDTCTNCSSNNLRYNDNDCVCQDCGLVINENRLNTSISYDNTTIPVKYNKNCNSRISKMQEWYMWSNEEKNTYKLKTYVNNLCIRLKIIDSLINDIVDTSVMVINCIKKNDGTKRARVKDGIIVCCIHYVSKDTSTQYSYLNLVKQLNLDIKYVTRAERIILELINSKKLHLDKNIILETQKPFDYVNNIIKKHKLKIDSDVLNDVKILIEICEDNDILLDHTPLSVGVGCFYYILQFKNIIIDLKIFSELYGLSSVTIIKTFNKLKSYDNQIKQIL